VAEYPEDAKTQIDALLTTLSIVVDENPDAEVQAVVSPVLYEVVDAIIGACDDTSALEEAQRIAFDPERPLRAADALALVKRLATGR
jgi:hypothetical protein